MMNQPLISIVVAAKNAESTIEKNVVSILGLKYSHFELIVVDDGSLDRTKEILLKFSSTIRVISLPKSVGPSAARNLGVVKARGDYIAFTDADCIVDPFWLVELLKGAREHGAISCGGRQEIPADASEFQTNIHMVLKKCGFISDYMRPHSSSVTKVSHNASCCVLYKKDVLIQSKGLLIDFWPGEDVELDYRLKKAGHILVCNPNAIVHHYRPDSFKKYRNMLYRYGAAQGFLVKKYGIFRYLQLVPFIMILAVLFFAAGLIYLPYFLLAFVVALLIIMILYFNGNFLLIGLALSGFIAWHQGFYRGFFSPRI